MVEMRWIQSVRHVWKHGEMGPYPVDLVERVLQYRTALDPDDLHKADWLDVPTVTEQ